MRGVGIKRLAATSIAAVSAIAMFAAPQFAGAEIYLGGGTVVFKEQGQTPRADDGATICEATRGLGVGGGCIPFNGVKGAIAVSDLGRQLLDGDGERDIAFQVCIDNNGDNKCTSPDFKPCPDAVFFSHADDGRFFNPLGPLPGARSSGPGCSPAGWNGYVVFICEGVHAVKSSDGSDRAPAHSHPATTGQIDWVNADSADPADGTGPGGFGDFCGGTRELVVEKDYQVIAVT